MQEGWQYDSDDQDMNELGRGVNVSEIRAGLSMIGFNTDVVEWMLSSEVEIPKEVNEVQRGQEVSEPRPRRTDLSRAIC